MYVYVGAGTYMTHMQVAKIRSVEAEGMNNTRSKALRPDECMESELKGQSSSTELVGKGLDFCSSTLEMY